MSLSASPNEIVLEIASYLSTPCLNSLLRTNSHLSLLLSASLLSAATTPTYEVAALVTALATSNTDLMKKILTYSPTPVPLLWVYGQSFQFTIYTTTGMVRLTHSQPNPVTPELLAHLSTHGATTTVSIRDITCTPLSWAIYHNLPSAISLIPRSHMTIDAQLCFRYLNPAPSRPHAQSPLHIASARNTAVIPALLAQGASMRTRDSRGYTPLHTAASLGVLPAVELLLAAGADPDGWHDNNVWTPLALAAWYYHPDVVAALIDGGAIVNRALRAGGSKTGAEGWNVLHRMVARMSVAEEGGIWRDVHGAQREVWSVNWEAMFRMLMEKGADPTAPDAKGRSARFLAHSYGMVDVVKVLGEVWPWETVGHEWWCAGGWERVTGKEVGKGEAVEVEVMNEKAWRVWRRQERERLTRGE